jgi:NADH-quinone oxidoreductase subunit G
MKHVGTTCTHCADGCKTTSGRAPFRRPASEIVRGDNRDKSGINNDFLCIKGRYAFDFANHEDRLTQPLIRKNGKLTPSTWEEAFELVGKRLLNEVRMRDGGSAIGVIGSTHTTNEENYLLQKFARVVLETNNIDHHRTADFPAFGRGMPASQEITASMRDVYNAPAVLLIGNDPTEQHPLLAWQIRNNVRLHGAKLYVVNSREIKLRRQATTFGLIPAEAEPKIAAYLAGDDSVLGSLGTDTGWSALRDKLRGEQNLVIVFGSEISR